MTRTSIDIHILQTVPPSNLNRDDTGSPKTAVYGGVRRARVSSQAWKRATRKAFETELDSSHLGVRTKHVPEVIAQAIAAVAPEFESRALELAGAVLKAAKIVLTTPKAKKGEDSGQKPDESTYLLFLSNHQINRLAELAVEAERSRVPTETSVAKHAANTEHSIDVALFGRMVADAQELTVDASAQVAHAISVHAVETEYDYFTAVDDRAPDDNVGAGMIGTVEFNSSTLYRYATINVDSLAATLGDVEATRLAVGAFLRSFVTSMPTGKQNTFANGTLPDAVVVQIRNGQSINLVGAFEEAVTATDGSGRLESAASRLADHAESIDAAYGTAPAATFVVRVGSATEVLGRLGVELPLADLVERVADIVGERLPVTA